jgi:4-hydroxy-tetrahydrodipicolinate synthase
MFHGSIVALITPFRDGKVDYDKLAELIEFHILNGTDGIVPCGTTGESATLTYEEHHAVIDFTVKRVKGRIAVIVGTGSNSTAEAVELAEVAQKSGADAHLSITPYYNKPTQEGLFLHFKAIAEKVDLPMLMYNVPGRCGVNMLPETVGRLSRLPNIVGLKEATGDMKQAAEIMENVRSGFVLLSGDDFTNLPLLALGGVGAISVTANIAPKECSAMFRAWEKGDAKAAAAAHIALMPLHRAMFLETSPIPVKTAAKMMGLLDVLEFRLPLCDLQKVNEDKLRSVLAAKGMVK